MKHKPKEVSLKFGNKAMDRLIHYFAQRPDEQVKLEEWLGTQILEQSKQEVSSMGNKQYKGNGNGGIRATTIKGEGRNEWEQMVHEYATQYDMTHEKAMAQLVMNGWEDKNISIKAANQMFSLHKNIAQLQMETEQLIFTAKQQDKEDVEAINRVNKEVEYLMAVEGISKAEGLERVRKERPLLFSKFELAQFKRLEVKYGGK